MPDWNDLLFGGRAAETVPAATGGGSARGRSPLVQRIWREAQRQGVDPALAVAVATQESYLNPGAVGDHGKSLGLFQLQRAAAIDAGIDPNRRGEMDLNIRGGVTYLKQKLQQSGGSVEQALSRYNRGTPTYKGIGDPHYVEHVMRHYQGPPGESGRLPGVATAAREPAPREWGQLLFPPGTPEPVSASPPVARDWGAELGLQGASRAPEAPAAVPPAQAVSTGTPRAWGQELGLAQDAVPEASNAPAAPARAWAALLFG
jgi:hypothetical protein